MSTAPKPATTRELRWFGVSLGASLGLAFGWVLPASSHTPRPHWPWLALAALWLVAGVAPRALAPLQRVSTRVTAFVTAAQLRLVLVLVYFCVWLPLGLVLRLLGRDALGLRWDSAATSYRSAPRRRPPEPFDKPY
jgi:hypothetical protein